MTRLFAAVLSVALFASAGAAWAQSAMSSTFGNTVAIADASGNTIANYYFNEDGTFTITAADGTEAAGSWAEDGGELCLTLGETTTCNPVDGSRDVGDSWEDTDPEGNTIVITIVEGR